MSKRKVFLDNSDNSTPFNSTDQDELLKSFDKKRRSFLKKLLISAAYVTPVILSFSIGELDARAKKLPTKKKR